MVCGCLRLLRKQMNNFFAHATQRVFDSVMNSVPAHEIIPGVWLGNKGASMDRAFLAQNNINVIINCTKDLPFVKDMNLKLYRVPVDDNLEDAEIRNLELWAYEIAVKIARERAAGNRILIHCFAGVQRSAATTAIFLISSYRCSADEAISYIRSKRPIAFFGNVNFYRAIKGFETSFQNMIADRGVYADFPRIPLP
jgi:atypical dual specificity phosphatase